MSSSSAPIRATASSGEVRVENPKLATGHTRELSAPRLLAAARVVGGKSREDTALTAHPARGRETVSLDVANVPGHARSLASRGTAQNDSAVTEPPAAFAGVEARTVR